MGTLSELEPKQVFRFFEVQVMWGRSAIIWPDLPGREG